MITFIRCLRLCESFAELENNVKLRRTMFAGCTKPHIRLSSCEFALFAWALGRLAVVTMQAGLFVAAPSSVLVTAQREPSTARWTCRAPTLAKRWTPQAIRWSHRSRSRRPAVNRSCHIVASSRRLLRPVWNVALRVLRSTACRTSAPDTRGGSAPASCRSIDISASGRSISAPTGSSGAAAAAAQLNRRTANWLQSAIHLRLASCHAIRSVTSEIPPAIRGSPCASETRITITTAAAATAILLRRWAVTWSHAETSLPWVGCITKGKRRSTVRPVASWTDLNIKTWLPCGWIGIQCIPVGWPRHERLTIPTAGKGECTSTFLSECRYRSRTPVTVRRWLAGKRWYFRS